jgi:hypothetical protein
MAHYAKLDENNLVMRVEVVDNNVLLDDNGIENEELGIQFLEDLHGWPIWKKTSYNTQKGFYLNNDQTPASDQTKAFRKNYAGIGFTYDVNRDAFIPPKPFNSWILNETSCTWVSPSPEPESTNEIYPFWSEENLRWQYISLDGTQSYYYNSEGNWVLI